MCECENDKMPVFLATGYRQFLHTVTVDDPGRFH